MRFVAIGAAVLRTACAEAATWAGVPGACPRLHVNVSPAQLLDAGFVPLVRSCLQDTAMADRLVLEVTESAALETSEALSALDEVRGLGVRLALDDFRTGASALSTLRTLRPDVVKIDRSFVAGAPARRADVAVVEAIVQMAARLGLQTVAEGVERLDQQDHLRRSGVDCAQGFLHLRPAPDLAAWLASQATAPVEVRGSIPLAPAAG